MSRDLQGDFGIAYVKAVAHAAGYFAAPADRSEDNDGLDLTVFRRSTAGTVRSPRLGIQVKTTTSEVSEDPFAYDLPVKNYDELSDETWQVPRILVLVSVPVDRNDWVTATEAHLLLRNCAYWKSLRGQPATQNSATTRVWLSRSARFHQADLQAIMQRLSEGGLP